MINAHIIYLGLGSNLGDGAGNIRHAITLLQEHVGHLLATSALIESEPWGFQSPHRFTNAAVAMQTELSPEALLEATQNIERWLGRQSKHLPGQPYQDRTIDIDILLYDDLQLQLPQLTIPHPHIAERDFVSGPLQECQEKVYLLNIKKESINETILQNRIGLCRSHLAGRIYQHDLLHLLVHQHRCCVFRQRKDDHQ